LLKCIFASIFVIAAILNTTKFTLDLGSGVVDVILLGDGYIAPVTHFDNPLHLTQKNLWDIVDAVYSYLGCVEWFHRGVCKLSTCEAILLATLTELSVLIVVLHDSHKLIGGLLLLDKVW
jgi:hypothetical protein